MSVGAAVEAMDEPPVMEQKNTFLWTEITPEGGDVGHAESAV